MNKKIKITAMLIAVLSLISSLFCYPLTAKAQITSEYYTKDILQDVDSGSLAVGTNATLDINAKSVVLIEPNTKQVLYSKNENEKLSPASITKIMSLLLVMEAIENEKIKVILKTENETKANAIIELW